MGVYNQRAWNGVRRVVVSVVVFTVEKKLKISTRKVSSIKSTGKMRGKRSENCISFSLPPFKEGCFNKEKERTKGSVERALSSVSCARVFVSVLRVVLPTIERKRSEKHHIAMRKLSSMRCEIPREKMKRKHVPKAWTRRVRSRPRPSQPRVSQTRTNRRARAPWAFSKSSRRERRKTQSGDALRRTSSLVFCWWWGCYYAVNHVVCYFLHPVSYFPPPLLYSLVI